MNRELFFKFAQEIAWRLRLPGINLHFDDYLYSLGSYSPYTNIIRINPSKHYTEDDMILTLFHEFGHFIQFHRHHRWAERRKTHEILKSLPYREWPLEKSAEKMMRIMERKFQSEIYRYKVRAGLIRTPSIMDDWRVLDERVQPALTRMAPSYQTW